MISWYDDVMRTIIELPDEQVRALADYCLREKVSRAEAIRRAVEQMVRAQQADETERMAAIDAAFGLWKDRGIDTDTYLRELRVEWDR